MDTPLNKLRSELTVNGYLRSLSFSILIPVDIIQTIDKFYHQHKAYDMKIKLCMIGDNQVGKSSVLLRFTDNQFTTPFITTIGIDFKTKTVAINNKMIRLNIWDHNSSERYRITTTAYYRMSDGILLVYDVTDKHSFLNIRFWMRSIDQYLNSLKSHQLLETIIIGNKCDMIDNRCISTEQGQELADEYGVTFCETSAKSNINVDKAFLSIAVDIIKQKQNKITNDIYGNISNVHNVHSNYTNLNDPNTNRCACILL
eukprot:548403_1